MSEAAGTLAALLREAERSVGCPTQDSGAATEPDCTLATSSPTLSCCCCLGLPRKPGGSRLASNGLDEDELAFSDTPANGFAPPLRLAVAFSFWSEV